MDAVMMLHIKASAALAALQQLQARMCHVREGYVCVHKHKTHTHTQTGPKVAEPNWVIKDMRLEHQSR